MSKKEETAVVKQGEAAVAAPKETALEVLEVYSVVLPPMLSQKIDADMMEDMEGMSLRFDRVPWPGAGNLAIKVPNFADPTTKPRTIEDLDVVILHNHDVRAYYSVPFDQRAAGSSGAPDCYSVDGKRGIGMNDAGGDCNACDKSKFIPKVGTACPIRRRLYCVIVGERAIDGELPFVIDVPVTSVGMWAKYITWLVKSGYPAVNKLITRLSFEEKLSRSNVKYSHGLFSLIGKLPESEFELMSDIKQRVKEWAVSAESMQAAAQVTPIASGAVASDIPF